MVRYELDRAPGLTREEKAQLEKAEKQQVIYDEDSPALTEEMIEAFQEARKNKPYQGRGTNCKRAVI